MADANFETFFSSSGCNFALGISPPKITTEFKGIRNTSHGDSTTPFFQDKARVAPVIHSQYIAVRLPVRGGSVSANGTPIAAGLTPTLAAIWSNPPQTDYIAQQQFGRGYYYDVVNNNLYMLRTSSAGQRASGIWKTDMVNGNVTHIVALFADECIFSDDNSGCTLTPSNPADPDASDWTVTFADTSISIIQPPMTARTFNTAGAVINDVVFKVDSGDTNQTVPGNGGYVSLDKTMVLSEWRSSSSSATRMTASFVVMRGGSMNRVEFLFDGVFPIPASITQSETADGVTSTLVTAWGNSVLFLADKADTDAVDPISVLGVRCFERVDFDRWLNDVCDIYKMNAGEVMY